MLRLGAHGHPEPADNRDSNVARRRCVGKLATGRGCQPDSLSYAVARPAEPLGQAPHAGAVRNARLRSLLDSPAVATAARWRVPGFAIAARIRGSWCRPRVSPHGVAPTHRVGADHLVPWRVSPPTLAPIHCPTRFSKT